LASQSGGDQSLFRTSMEIILFQAGAQILRNERSNIGDSFLFGV